MKSQTESKCARYGSLKPSTNKKTVLFALASFLLVIQVVKSATAINVTDDDEFTSYDNRNFNNNHPTELTFCQQLRSFESRRARTLQDEGRSNIKVRIPKCSRSGQFEQIQCSNELNGTECFCVDEYGVEVVGTRVEGGEEKVNCSAAVSHCSAVSCRMFCPSGFARDLSSGCPVCKCRDPCNDVICPNGQACEAIEIKCKDDVCPPLPTCRKSRTLNELCPAGAPLSIAGTVRPFLCGNELGKPQCPPLFKCLVQAGNDYGVCCPSSLKFEKPGTCPREDEIISTPENGILCGSPCSHDLECPQLEKCCGSNACGGRTCKATKDSTLCHQAKLQVEILSIGEREGRGYVPQCDDKSGQFNNRQCSNNGLVCWCVNPSNGNKIKGTIGAAKSVKCDNIENLLVRSGARSVDGMNHCDLNICAAICQYGFKTDHKGCSTCECEEPCEGFNCPAGTSCVVAKDPKCLSGSGLCDSEPICKPNVLYSNPCRVGTPLTSNTTDEVVFCEEEFNSPEYQPKSFFDSSVENSQSKSIKCPEKFSCTKLLGQSESVCCPVADDSVVAESQQPEIQERSQSMCEYLRDFGDRMEGTEEGMSLALKQPRCAIDGSFTSMQCQVKKVMMTKSEQRKIIEQNNIREMRKLISNRSKRDTLKLIRVDSDGRDFSTDYSPEAKAIVDFLRKKIFDSPERFLTDLFGTQTESRAARLVDIQAEEDEDEDENVEKSEIDESRNDRKLSMKAQQQQQLTNDLVDVDVEECFCVDGFGTEIPRTRGHTNVSEVECNRVRDSIECLDLTCRMGCDYGFVLDPESQCPSCTCRDPCDGVQCDENQECRTVEVSCEGEYCPPVPVCFTKKPGQCPYLVPPAGEDSEDVCAYECRSDNHCSESKKCCSNGCGTVCIEPQFKSACQHLQSIQIHQAIELGMPAKQKYIAQCNEDGAWRTIQCGPNNTCWCVDDRGNEKSGTRTLSGIPDCAVTRNEHCPMYKCKPCEHGYEFDENGCKTCTCKDLCKEIRCPVDEQCELVQVECIGGNNSTQPCPRMPICVPIRDSICTEGLPLKQNGRELTCGPEADACPTTHSCNLNPITKRGVCCAKSRDVCFESIDSSCLLSEDDSSIESVIKYRFNPRVNKCTPIRLSKVKHPACSSKNLFHSEKACRSVCPVLTQCERLRLKNSIAARRRADKSDTWFKPRCDAENGAWSAVQCIGENTNDSTRVCWCADKKGSPIKGSLTKGTEPTCNHRQARRRMSVDEISDPVMEELIRQITFLTDENNFLDENESKSDEIIAVTEKIVEIAELSGESTKKLIASTTRCDALRSSAHFEVNCDEGGNFVPIQCNGETCWCVDEAGNQLPWTSMFRKNTKKCKPTMLNSVDIELMLVNPNHVKLRNLYDVLYDDIKNLIGDGFVNFRVQENTNDDSVTMKFDLIDDRKIDQAFALEEMSKEENLFLFHGMLKPDITKSKFTYKIPMKNASEAQKASLGIPENTFHTIVFILATSSAFIISILVIYVMLKKGKQTKTKSNYSSNKNLHSGDKFIDYSSPIFVLSANDVRTSNETRNS